MSASEDSAQKNGETLMDTTEDHFVQPAPPEKHHLTNGLKEATTEAPAASTIMITNKYSNSASQTHNSNNSIMILTSHNHTDVSSNITSSSQINICINNHFSDTITSSSSTVTTDTPASPHKKISVQQLDEPDSTTCHFKDSSSSSSSARSQPPAATPIVVALPDKDSKDTIGDIHPPDAPPPPPKAPATFAPGEEVFVRREDVFYLGTVVVVGRKQCCVSFGDDTKCWAYFHDMTKVNLAADASAGPFCVHCKERGGSEPDAVVDVCKRCQRGYHKKCTGLDAKTAPGNHCKRCLEQNSLNGVNGGRFFYKTNNAMGDERLSYSDNSLSPLDTGNFFPLRSVDYKDAWSAAASPNNSDMSTASSNGNPAKPGRRMTTCGRRLRERQEKNYAESTRRSAPSSTPATAPSSGCSNSDTSSSSSSSSSLINFSATTFLSQQLLSSSHRQGTSSRPGSAAAAAQDNRGLSIFRENFDTNTSSHIAKGEKYVIRGKRIDNDGNIQYLVEWEGVS